MWVGYEFPGDDNITLKMVQHGCYWDKIGLLFIAARKRYVSACRFIGFETVVCKRIIKIDGFDHRVLQHAHDKIAAYYRFAHDDGGQMALFSPEQPIQTYFPDSDEARYKAKLLTGWSQFYDEEVKDLAEDNVIAHAILNAVLYQNSPKGYEAEDFLLEELGYRYSEMNISKSEDDMWCSASKLEDND